MTIGIRKIRGLDTKHANALLTNKISNSERLLESSKTPKARKTLAATTGISEQRVLEYANRADLARVKGIGVVFSEHAGGSRRGHGEGTGQTQAR